jgi:hypothetical protein
VHGQEGTIRVDAPEPGSNWTAGVGQSVSQSGTFNYTNSGSYPVTITFSGSFTISQGGAGNPVASSVTVGPVMFNSGSAGSSGNSVTVGAGTTVSVPVNSVATVTVNTPGATGLTGSITASGGGGGSSSPTASANTNTTVKNKHDDNPKPDTET